MTSLIGSSDPPPVSPLPALASSSRKVVVTMMLAGSTLCCVTRIAHAGCGQFREDGVEGGASLGSQISGDRAHAVEALLADGETPPPSSVVVGEVSVRVEAIGE